MTRGRAIDLCTRAHAVDHRRSTMLSKEGTNPMLSTIVVVLVLLWLLGITTAYTLGGLIHVLLVIAVVIVLLRVIQGRNPLRG
jgi:Family of unknown function (DUF5670)